MACGKNTIAKARPTAQRGVCWSDTNRPRDSPALANEQALQLFLNHVLQHLFVEAEIGHHLLQSTVLHIELLEATELGNAQATVLLLPVAKRRLRDTIFSTDFFNSSPRLRPTQRKRDLFLLVLRLLHPAGPPSSQKYVKRPNSLVLNGPDFREEVTLY